MSVFYSANVMRRAREHREAGWSLRRICDFIEREVGRRPSPSTVQAWVNPRAHQRKIQADQERHRAFSALGSAAGGRLGSPRHTPEFKFARMLALRDLDGMSCQAIASAMHYDFGDELTADQVRWALSQGRIPRSIRRSAAR